jgi:hypothetical protein
MSPQYQIIRTAILKHQQLVVSYKGYLREVCPHVIGHKNGREKVLTYQFGGGSSSGLPPAGEWRCMFIDEIAKVVAKDGQWHTGNSHTQPQTCVDYVDVDVSKPYAQPA